MKKIRVCVVGYGNVGREAVECIRQAPDMEPAGVVRRVADGSAVGIPEVTRVEELGSVDVVILALPSRLIPAAAPLYLQKGFNTVDGYDIHGEAMLTLRNNLGTCARENRGVAITGAGWDPGSDSIIRMLFTAIAPVGITYTDFGPGMSMGHGAAARSIPGVKDALSLTLPLGYGRHRRDIYVVLEEGADFEKVAARIRSDPYFRGERAQVMSMDNIAQFKVTSHAVCITRRGSSGSARNQLLELRMKLTNPAATAQIMVAAARASMRLEPGGYVLGEIPPLHLLPGSGEEIIKNMV